MAQNQRRALVNRMGGVSIAERLSAPQGVLFSVVSVRERVSLLCLWLKKRDATFDLQFPIFYVFLKFFVHAS
jgi:hypothetical protein